MSSFTNLAPGADRATMMQRVVVQHILDGLHSGNEMAAALARSLMTELDAAGVPVDTDVDHAAAEGAVR